MFFSFLFSIFIFGLAGCAELFLFWQLFFLAWQAVRSCFVLQLFFLVWQGVRSYFVLQLFFLVWQGVRSAKLLEGGLMFYLFVIY